MNQYALLHIPDSRYCFATGPKEVVIRLRTSKEDDLKVSIVYASKYEIANMQQEEEMTKYCEDALYRFYETKLSLTDVRLAYVFKISEGSNSWYFSEDGITKDYDFSEAFYNFFQLPYININDLMPTVDWMRRAVFYQIFVDRFYIGDHDKDMSYVNMKWGDIPTPKCFAGGDLAGISKKLDYLKMLGINAIYLTPVFRSISNHKYDISDYKEIDPEFGTKEELVDLVKKAHSMGIRIVLDAVFNHCSMDSPQFKDVMKKGRDSEYFNWFIIDGDKPDIKNVNYECFASCGYMPKLNTANAGVQGFLLDIAEYWIREADIDGWRLDVSDEVSHEFWRLFRKRVKSVKKDCVIIGENWHDAYSYLLGDQYDSIMNYAFTKACLDYFANDRFNATDMADKCNSNLMRNKDQVNQMMLNLLDSHDTHRFFSEVGKDVKKLIAAIALNVMYPGAPCIYYGTEILMEGGYDPDCRRCFDWDESHWNKDAWKEISRVLHLKEHKALQYGECSIISVNDMLVVERSYKDEKITLFVNMTDKAQRVPAGVGKLIAGLEINGVIEKKGYGIYLSGKEMR